MREGAEQLEKKMSTSCTNSTVEYPLCGYFSPNLTLHISHLLLVHSSDRSFNIVCSVRGCTETFGAFAAYNSHVYCHHRDALGLETFPDSDDMILSAGPYSVGKMGTPSSIVPVDATFSNDDEHDTAISVHEVAPVLSVPLSDSGPSSQTTRAAKFLLQRREGTSNLKLL